MRAAHGRGGISVRELARLVDRDAMSVHEDITVLVNLGVVEFIDHRAAARDRQSEHIPFILVPHTRYVTYLRHSYSFGRQRAQLI